MSWSITLEKWVRREALLVTFLGVMTAITTFSAIVGWTPVWIAAAALGVAGAAGRLAIRFRRTQLEDERERTALDRRVRTAVAPLQEVRAVEIGVDRAAQDILPGGETPDYLPREADQRVQDALESALDGSGPWLVVVHGPAKVGKSRTLYEALRKVCERGMDLILVTPADGDSVRSLLVPDGSLRETDGRLVVWLDDLETFVAEGVNLDTLREWHRKTGAIFAATYGGKGSERLRDSGTATLTVLTDTLLSNGTEIGLGPTNAVELARLDTPLSEADRRAIEYHGLAAAMVAARALERKIGTRRHAPSESESPEGAAIVSAAIDWARCGRTNPIPRSVLRGLWSGYLQGGTATDDAFERGLVWALRPVAGSISLLTSANGYNAYDYIVRLASERPEASPPREEAWQAALDTTEVGQIFNVGVEAYFLGREDHALTGMRIASRASDKEMAGTANANLGLLLTDRGDSPGAANAYRRAIELGNSRGAVNLGVLLNGQSDFEGAENAYRQAAEMGDGMGASNLGVLLKERGDLQGAKTALRQAAELGDEYGAMCLGMLLKEQGDSAGAEDAYRRAAELGPDGVATLGGLLLNRGDVAGAEDIYRKAMEQGSKTAPANLGVMLKERGDLVGAETALRLAAERGNGYGAFNLGVLLQEQGDLAGAEDAYRRAAELDDGAGAAALGVLLKARGDLAGAEEAHRKAMDLGHGGGAANLGVLLRGRGEVEGAEAAFRRSAELGYDGGALNLGVLLEEQKDFEGAEHAYLKALEMGNRQAGSKLGLLLEAREDPEAAESAYRGAMVLGSGEGASDLGRLLMARGDLEGAEAAWREGIELGAGLAAYNLGFLLRDRGDAEGTKAAWRTAAELGNGEGAFNLGYLLAEQGDIEGARQALQLAIDSGHEEAAARAANAIAELS
ncbi:MAG TPA: tetratricopeptide repeat protein [Solirubrobacterales bacterium]|nr:tetratricopeptide repeat protein [Solirubrobacterales bacterium]